MTDVTCSYQGVEHFFLSRGGMVARELGVMKQLKGQGEAH